jgi:FkbM family methyltransferase
LFPAGDDHAEYVLSQQGDVYKFIEHVKGRSCVVQAGGYCGQFPALYGRLFDAVYTFEPNPENFYCLARNAPNVHKFQAFLGDRRGLGGMNNNPGEEKNFGAWYRDGFGLIPTLMIDDLGVAPDLIQLDMEGGELDALKGGRRTIEAHRPVVVVENKPLRQGNSNAIGYMQELGYAARQVTKWDWLLLPNSSPLSG